MNGETVAKIGSLKQGDKHGTQTLPYSQNWEVDVSQTLRVGEDEENKEEYRDGHGADQNRVEPTGLCITKTSRKRDDDDGNEVLEGEGEPRIIKMCMRKDNLIHKGYSGGCNGIRKASAGGSRGGENGHERGARGG